MRFCGPIRIKFIIIYILLIYISIICNLLHVSTTSPKNTAGWRISEQSCRRNRRPHTTTSKKSWQINVARKPKNGKAFKVKIFKTQIQIIFFTPMFLVSSKLSVSVNALTVRWRGVVRSPINALTVRPNHWKNRTRWRWKIDDNPLSFFHKCWGGKFHDPTESWNWGYITWKNSKRKMFRYHICFFICINDWFTFVR